MSTISVEIKARFTELTTGMRQAAQSVRSSLEDIGRKIEETKRTTGSLGTTLQSLSGIAVGIGVGLTAALTAPIIGVGTGALKASAQIETLQAAFVPLLGGAAAAKAKIQELQVFANTTPFEMPEVAQASRVLQVLTNGALAGGDALRMIGDVASSVNQPFSDVAMWVGRLYSGLQAGAPVGEATMRLIEMGAITNETKLKIEAMQKAGLKGNEVWALAAKDFAQFGGGMATQAQTMAGKWSTLQDSIRTSLARIGDALAPTAKTILDVLTKVADAVGGLAGVFASLPGPVKGAIVVVAGLAAALGPLLVALGGIAAGLAVILPAWPLIAAAMTAALPVIGSAAVAIAGVTAAVALLATGLDVLKNGWTATGREEIRQAREAARIEEETKIKVAAMRKRFADERAAAANAKLLEEMKAQQEAVAKGEKERKRIAEQTAKAIADFRIAEEQRVIDYANGREQARADRDAMLRQKLVDAEWARKVALEKKLDDEDAAKKARKRLEAQQEYDRGLEQTRARIEEEDRIDAERAERTKARWALAGQVVGTTLTSPLQASFGRFFESGRMGFSRLWQDMKNGFKAALADMMSKLVTSGLLRLLGGLIGGPIGASISGMVPSFAVGTPYVERDMVANLHQGERVLTREQNQAFSTGSLGGGGSARGVYVDLEARTMEILRRNGRALIEIHADQVGSFAMGAA